MVGRHRPPAQQRPRNARELASACVGLVVIAALFLLLGWLMSTGLLLLVVAAALLYQHGYHRGQRAAERAGVSGANEAARDQFPHPAA